MEHTTTPLSTAALLASLREAGPLKHAYPLLRLSLVGTLGD